MIIIYVGLSSFLLLSHPFYYYHILFENYLAFTSAMVSWERFVLQHCHDLAVDNIIRIVENPLSINYLRPSTEKYVVYGAERWRYRIIDLFLKYACIVMEDKIRSSYIGLKYSEHFCQSMLFHCLLESVSNLLPVQNIGRIRVEDNIPCFREFGKIRWVDLSVTNCCPIDEQDEEPRNRDESRACIVEMKVNPDSTGVRKDILRLHALQCVDYLDNYSSRRIHSGLFIMCGEKRNVNSVVLEEQIAFSHEELYHFANEHLNLESMQIKASTLCSLMVNTTDDKNDEDFSIKVWKITPLHSSDSFGYYPNL